MKKIRTFILLVSLFSISCLTFSQEIKKQEIDSAVSKIASLVKANYVFEDKGNTISEELLLLQKQGKFDNIKNWQSLADSLTVTLRYLGNDKHLYVKNDPASVKEMIESENQTEEGDELQTSEDPFYYGKEAEENNFGFSEVKILEQNVGYIKLNEINFSEKSLPTLYSVMTFISHTRALIIDLRNNGGGGSDVGPVLTSYFLPKDVLLLEVRSRTGETSYSKTVNWLTEKKYDKPLFIIVNQKTGSAAEAFAFCLQYHKRARIVGQHSAGAANMNSWYIVNDKLYVSVSTSAPTIPNTLISWETTGVKPDFKVDAGKEIDYILGILNR